MGTAVRAVALPRPALAIAAGLVLAGLIAAIAIGQLVPAGNAAGVVVRGGWRPLEWSADGSTLLARSAGYALIDRSGRVTPVAGTVLAARWVPALPGRLALVDGGAAPQRLVLRDVGAGSDQMLAEAEAVGSFGLTDDASGWAVETGDGLLYGGSLLGASGGGLPASAVATTRDGSLIVFRTTQREPAATGALAVSDVRDGRLTVITVVAVDEDAPIALSPAGGAVAFLGRLGDSEGAVLVPLEPRGPPSLLVPDAGPGTPVWSADERALLVPRVSPGTATLEIVAVRMEGGQARLEPLGPGGVASWLDVSTALIVEPSGDLVRMAADGSGRRVLDSGADPGCSPIVAADGTVAYCAGGGVLRILRPR